MQGGGGKLERCTVTYPPSKGSPQKLKAEDTHRPQPSLTGPIRRHRRHERTPIQPRVGYVTLPAQTTGPRPYVAPPSTQEPPPGPTVHIHHHYHEHHNHYYPVELFLEVHPYEVPYEVPYEEEPTEVEVPMEAPAEVPVEAPRRRRVSPYPPTAPLFDCDPLTVTPWDKAL